MSPDITNPGTSYTAYRNFQTAQKDLKKHKPSMSHTPSLTAPDMAGTDRDFHTGQKSEPMPEDTVLNIADIGTCTYKLPEHSQEFLNRSYTPKKRPSITHVSSILIPDIAYNLYIH